MMGLEKKRYLRFQRLLFLGIYVKISGWYIGVSKNRGTPKSSILIGFSIINHPFWGTPIFGNTHICIYNNFGNLFLLKEKTGESNSRNFSSTLLLFVFLHFNYSWVSILPKDGCRLVVCLLAWVVAELFCAC